MRHLRKVQLLGSVCRHVSSIPSSSTVNVNNLVFDRALKKRQRDWAFQQPDYEKAQYLREEVGWRVADKIFDLTKFNELVLDIGCGGGFIAPHLIKENVGKLIQVEVERRCVDEESLEGFEENQFDLLVSSMSAHWINDLPGWMKRCNRILKPDCPIIGSMLAEDTLYELRCSLQLAEMERKGGMGVHISPFVRAQDISGLLSSAGFDMITLDVDEIEVGYPDMFALLYDLQLMSESNCTYMRSYSISRDVLVAADAIYKSMYAKEEKYPATFKVLSFIAWKPGPNMPKPAKRGSQNVSLKDIDQLVKNPELLKKLSDEKKNE